ncbi:DUF1289 domain-containing protein [Arenimonas oryziterrae]|uniref:Fe-S protein n=1 Tax=Arenimonas oryziterrae DSM 21050 = YC6267 TaxID=1121015 RepID=A0A091ATS1_9GAMM|nr:DUF1289 domain-containing protein [Arenimonas oryziterrae]KFN42562.1 hypothetical protein N789_13055 [Arenimonas oryziterrae DSM 21050 = YC6267]
MNEPPLRPVPRDPRPDSPCVRNCCLDESDVCLGCGRHIDEILRWQQATAEERTTILGLAADRRALRDRRLR